MDDHVSMADLHAAIEENSRTLNELLAAVGRLQRDMDYLRSQAHVEVLLRRAERDRDIPELARRLGAARRSEEYREAFEADRPLVTIAISTYDRPDTLVQVALASARRQTYPHLDIVVVHDGPGEATREAIGAVDDPRVRYFELPQKTVLPYDRLLRWQVAGAAAKNEGVRRAEGLWITQLDDDDELSPDHVEKLLALARASRGELVYGATVQRNLDTGEELVIWSDPPVRNRFSFLNAMYLRCIGFLEYDEQGWLADEPEDWRLAQRMLAAGVTWASTEEVVGTIYMLPYRLK